MNLAGADCPLLCRQNPNIISPRGWVIGFVVDITKIMRMSKISNKIEQVSDLQAFVAEYLSNPSLGKYPSSIEELSVDPVTKIMST